MAINMSPGVYVKEKDLTDIVRGVASSSAGIVGYSAKGSTSDIRLITTNQEFIDQYGQPDPTTGHFFHYAALEYLRTGNSLMCLRVANAPKYAGMNVTHELSSELPTSWSEGRSGTAFDLGDGVSEVQTLTPDAVATAGTFTLTFGVDTTTAIDYNASLSTIELALNALDSVQAIGGVTVTGENLTSVAGMIVTFLPYADNVETLSADITLLTGPTVVDIIETTDGDDGGVAEVVMQIQAVNPGVWNNRIGVIITNVKNGGDPIATDQYTFDIQVNWQDDDGYWATVESFHVSRKNKIDGHGRTLYVEDVINGRSAYIRVADSAMDSAVLPKAMVSQVTLVGGSDGSNIGTSELILGWDRFMNPAEIDIRMLICGGETDTSVQLKMQEVAESRFDCVALLDVPWDKAQNVQDTITWRNDTLSINSSYCVLDAPWPKKYDPYNDKLIDMPPSGFRAQAIAYNDAVAHPWAAAAGFTRGQLNVSSIFPVYNEGHRDALSNSQVNMFQDFGGEGNVIWHQLTMQKKQSALSDLNVRRLLIQVEKSLSIALLRFVHEPNTPITRFRVESIINEYMEILAGQGAFQQEGGDPGFHVVCDESNNVPATIDRRILKVDVFIKPVRVIYYVNLQVVVTKTGTSFEEITARGVTF